MQVAIIIVTVVLGMALVAFFIQHGLRQRATAKALAANGIERPHGVKAWIVNHLPSKRRLIQVYAALLYNANLKGYITGDIQTSAATKYLCVPGLNCYSCPGAVGACPMGALQNALSESKTRAPYYMLGIIALFGVILARTICGFLCPVGLCQELLYKIRSPKLRKGRVTRILSYFKYVILALAIVLPLMYALRSVPLPSFCKYICPAGTFGGAVLLLIHPKNAGLFGQLGWLFTWKFCLLIAFAVASVFIFRVFCRFVCPLGAIYGFFNRFSVLGVTVEQDKCTHCGLCVRHCKMDVKCVGDHECIQCGECMAVCPTKAIRWKGSKVFKPRAAAEGQSVLHTKPMAMQAQADATVAMSAADTEIAVTSAVPPPSEDTSPPAVGVERPQASPPKSKAKKNAKFWVELSAWILALAVLCGALLYYNVLHKDKAVGPPPVAENEGYEVGDTAPDFTVKLYNAEDGSFTLSQNRGKVTVINYWATWCTPCVAEIPYFNELAQKYADIQVIAVHGTGGNMSTVQKFIETKGWRDYTMTFAQDNIESGKSVTYTYFNQAKDSATGAWPMTVVVDAEGKIVYNNTKSFHSFADLENAMLAFIA